MLRQLTNRTYQHYKYLVNTSAGIGPHPTLNSFSSHPNFSILDKSISL